MKDPKTWRESVVSLDTPAFEWTIKLGDKDNRGLTIEPTVILSVRNIDNVVHQEVSIPVKEIENLIQLWMRKTTSELPFDWSKIDTSLAGKDSDEQLLRALKTIQIIVPGANGWGLVAELAKRYADTKGVPRDI